MTPNPITIPLDTPLIDAHKCMTDNGIRRLPVMEDEELVGIITLGDVRGSEPSEVSSLNIWELNYLLSHLTVERAMTQPVATVAPDAAVAEAAQIMLEKRIAGLPVMKGERVVGIITESDIFRMVVEQWREPAQPAAS
jgi:acetoin utilization protein AcuB